MTAADRVSISIFREFVDEFARADTAAVLVYAGQIFLRTDPKRHEQSVVPFGANGSSEWRLSVTLPSSFCSLAGNLRSALRRDSLQPRFATLPPERGRMRILAGLPSVCHPLSILPHGERYGKSSNTLTLFLLGPYAYAKRIA